MLEALTSALPDKGGAAIIQQRDRRLVLVERALLVDAEGTQWRGKAAVQPQRAHAQSVAVRPVVLPDEIAATGFQAQGGEHLIAGQDARNTVFTTLRDETGLTMNERGCDGQKPAPCSHPGLRRAKVPAGAQPMGQSVGEGVDARAKVAATQAGELVQHHKIFADLYHAHKSLSTF